MNEFGLTDRERDIARQALLYLLESEALIHEFHTRMGVDETFVKKLLELDFDGLPASEQDDAKIAAHNGLNEILHGLYFDEESWAETFDFSRSEATAVLVKTEVLWNMIGIV